MADYNDKLVEICWDRCRGEDTDQLLRRYLPVIKRYAQIFNIKIVVDIPNGLLDKVAQDSRNIVHLHINSYPSQVRKATRLSNPSFFGLSVDREVSLPNLEFLERPVFGRPIPRTREIMSPEGHIVGLLASGNLYIYPGIIDSNQSYILSQILYWTVSDFVSTSTLGSEGIFTRAYESIKKGMRDNLRSKKGRKQFKLLEAFLKKSLRVSIEKLYRDYDAIEKVMTLKRQEYFKISEAVCDLEEKMEYATKQNEAKDFEIEFEKLMGMVDVISVKVEDGEKPHLVIRTGTILQSPNNIDSYDIGEFEITIFPGTGRNSIYFSQSRRLGPYKHVHASGNTTCFGSSSSEGLNNDIDRLINQFDIVPLVHLLLTFLKKESTKPKESAGNLPPSPIGEYGDEEKEKDKKNFVKFMRQVCLELSTSGLIIPYTNAIRSQESLRDERMRLRMEFKIIEDLIDSVGTRLATEEKLIREEIGRLKQDADIFWLAGNEDELQIYFDIPREDSTSSLGKLKGYILKINRNNTLEIFYGNSNSKTVLDELSTAKITRLSHETEKELHKLQTQGKISELVSRVKSLIIDGLFD